ncbi:MAG: tetratricopeptide repeat protein [Pseudomonadota bacterium]
MSDFLTDEEQAARLESWWERYGLLTILGVVLLVAAVVGYRWWQDRQAAATAAGAELYEAFLEAGTTEQSELAAQIDDVAGATGYPLLVRLRQAADLVTKEQFDEARTRYQEVVARTDNPALRDLALVRTARIEQQLGNSDAALAALGKARSTGFRSQVAELKGDIQLANGDRAAAHEAYRAAQAALGEGETNTLLELKIATTAATGNTAEEPAVEG